MYQQNAQNYPLIGINLRHRSRNPSGEDGWTYEQRLHVVAWDGPYLSPNRHQPKLPHSVTLSVAKGLAGWASRCFAARSMTVLFSCRAIAI